MEVTRAASILHYFGKEPDAAWLERFLHYFKIERMHAAHDGTPPNAPTVGGAGAFDMELAIPGGAVPAAGVTIVGVLPTHRRQGVLTALMRAQLDDVRRRGEPVACLWASEEKIYGRFGYGVAVMSMEMDVPRERSEFRTPLTTVGSPRIVSIDEAAELLPGVYDRVRVRTPGMLSRTPGWWRYRRMLDLPERRGGGGTLKCMVLEVDGRPEAYALYRMHFALEEGVSVGAVD